VLAARRSGDAPRDALGDAARRRLAAAALDELRRAHARRSARARALAPERRGHAHDPPRRRARVAGRLRVTSRAIPGPKGRFFTAHLKEARERPLDFMLEVRRSFGDVTQMRVGPMRLVLVTHPDDVKRVLVDRNTAYGRPAFVSMVRKLVGNGLLFSEGDV